MFKIQIFQPKELQSQKDWRPLRKEKHKTVLRIFNFSINETHSEDSSNKCSHLKEAMISRRLSKLMRFIVNNLMPNLESPRVPLSRAQKLLEVHLPQFGNSGTTYNILFSGDGGKIPF